MIAGIAEINHPIEKGQADRMVELGLRRLATVAAEAGYPRARNHSTLSGGWIHYEQAVCSSVGNEKIPQIIESDTVWLAVTPRVGPKDRIAGIDKSGDCPILVDS